MSTDTGLKFRGWTVHEDEKGLFLLWPVAGDGDRRVDLTDCHICEDWFYKPDALKVNGRLICERCADTIMNLEHHRRTRQYITWPNPEPERPAHRRRPIRPSTRRRVHERDFYACRYCGARQDLVIDHVIPVNKGGTNTVDNLVTACQACNLRKRDKSIEEAGLTLHPPEAFAP